MKELLKTYANILRKERAQLLLQARSQHQNETVTAIVEETTPRFRRAFPEMTEETKVEFLMQGVKEQLVTGLVREPPTNVAEFTT